MKVYNSCKNMCYYALLTLIKTNDIFLCKGILYLLLIPSPRTKAADGNIFIHKALKIWSWISFSLWAHLKEMKTTSFIPKWYTFLRDQKCITPYNSVSLTCNIVQRACYFFQREYCWTNGDAQGKKKENAFQKRKKKKKNTFLTMSIIGKYWSCQFSKSNGNETSIEYVSNWCFALPAEQRAIFTRLEKQVRTYNLSSFLNFRYWYKQQNSFLTFFLTLSVHIKLIFIENGNSSS